MINLRSHTRKLLKASLVALPAALVLLAPWALRAQQRQGPGHAQMKAQPQSLEERLNALQDKVAVLQNALKRGHQAENPSRTTHFGRMPMDGRSMQGKGGMGMGGMGKGGMGGGGMGDKMMGAMSIEGMKTGSSGSMLSAEPGQPGASHLLHIGSTGFFLDHPDHIELSREQQARLNQIKETWQLESAEMERVIEQAEQDVWAATATNQPDSAAIEAAVAKAEKARSRRRLAFVRAVMLAAETLTEEQRDALLGMTPTTH